MTNFNGKGKVAMIKTTPATVLDDIQRVMQLAGFEEALPRENRTGLKINVSWQTWYPACSSTPWQIEGVIKALQDADYYDLVGVHNDTVVVDTTDAEQNNKHKYVADKYIPCIYTLRPCRKWVEHLQKTPLAFSKIFLEGCTSQNR
jgi:hypothetical protein